MLRRRVLDWLADVPIEDPLFRDNATLIQVVAVLGVAGQGLAGAYMLLEPGDAGAASGYSYLAGAVGLAAALVLIRRGHPRLSLWCIIGALLANVVFTILARGMTCGFGFTRELVIPLVVAALLLGRRGLWLLFAFLVAVCGAGLARDQGLLGVAQAGPIGLPPFGAFGSTVVVFFFAVLVLDSLAGILRSALAQAQDREVSLKESERVLRFMFDMMPDAAALVRLDTQEFVSVSGGFTKYTGLTQAQVQGRTSRDFEMWADLEVRDRFLDTIRKEGEATNLEATFILKDGSTAQALVWGRVTRIGGVPHLLTVLRDISDWKAAQKERERLREQIQHAQRLDSLGSLAGGVAHDFNNMLGAIVGHTDLLLKDETDPVRAERLESILAAAMRSGELTRKLLAFGRKGKDLVESVDLALVVRECLAMLRPVMHADLRVEVAMAGAAVIDGDPGQLHQVVLNLCLNAVEAMGGGGLLSVSAGPRVLAEPGSAEDLLPAGSYVELIVADTGPGMAEEVRERVFEPFFTTKGQAGKPGTGLGLSMVYGIVHSHRGTIQVDSAPGTGTRFRVLLPQGNLAAAVPAAPAGSRPRLGAVLVVEDEPLLREVAMDALEHLGYQVHGAPDGSAGVEAFRTLHGSLLAVLLDLKMPVMGGREAFQAMHELDPTVPVLVCTGFGENAEVQDLLSMGALGMIAKPYRISDLAAGLAKVSIT